MEVLWDEDWVPPPNPVNRQTPVTTVPSPLIRNSGGNNDGIWMAMALFWRTINLDQSYWNNHNVQPGVRQSTDRAILFRNPNVSQNIFQSTFKTQKLLLSTKINTQQNQVQSPFFSFYFSFGSRSRPAGNTAGSPACVLLGGIKDHEPSDFAAAKLLLISSHSGSWFYATRWGACRTDIICLAGESQGTELKL